MIYQFQVLVKKRLKGTVEADNEEDARSRILSDDTEKVDYECGDTYEETEIESLELIG